MVGIRLVCSMAIQMCSVARLCAQLEPGETVIGLPEGDWLTVRDGAMALHGPFDAWLFRAGLEALALRPGPLALG